MVIKFISVLALVLLCSGCTPYSTQNQNLTPGGSGWLSQYTLDMKKGTFTASTPKDHVIGAFTATISTNGIATIAFTNLSSQVDAKAAEAGAAGNALLAEIIKTQGAANLAILNAYKDILMGLVQAAAKGITPGMSFQPQVTQPPPFPMSLPRTLLDPSKVPQRDPNEPMSITP